MPNPALQDPYYLDFCLEHGRRRFQINVDVVVRAEFNALKHSLPPQARGLAEGLMDRASELSSFAPFNLGHVVDWFDEKHDGEYVQTQMGHARVFLYYLPKFEMLKIIKEVK